MVKAWVCRSLVLLHRDWPCRDETVHLSVCWYLDWWIATHRQDIWVCFTWSPQAASWHFWWLPLLQTKLHWQWSSLLKGMVRKEGDPLVLISMAVEHVRSFHRSKHLKQQCCRILCWALKFRVIQNQCLLLELLILTLQFPVHYEEASGWSKQKIINKIKRDEVFEPCTEVSSIHQIKKKKKKHNGGAVSMSDCPYTSSLLLLISLP